MTLPEINNAALLPPYRTDAETALIPADPDGILFSPDWVEELILMEVHPETATAEGTLTSLIRILDHAAAIGVNGIWLTPIYRKGPLGNGYGNWGLHTLEPAVTGTDDTDEGWRRVRAFVDEAHKRNIRIFLDIITWGTTHDAPLKAEHPDWFKGEAWGGAAFDWKHDAFRRWFIERAVENIIKSGADGYRCDCEPVYAGYAVFAEIRTRLLAMGRKIAVIAEESSERRGSFDFEQDGVTGWIDWSRGQQYKNPRAYFLEGTNIVDAVKSGVLHGDKKAQQNGTSGRNKYYTYCVSNHDFHLSRTNKNRLVMGYQAIFTPYIPLWYLGTEFGMEEHDDHVIYFRRTEWELLERAENRAFLTDIARYIRIRRLYPEIFCRWEFDHRTANIEKVEADTILQSYARFADGKAIVIVPCTHEDAERITVKPDAAALGVTGEIRVTDLLTGAEISCRNNTFSVHIEPEHLGVYLLSGE